MEDTTNGMPNNNKHSMNLIVIGLITIAIIGAGLYLFRKNSKPALEVQVAETNMKAETPTSMPTQPQVTNEMVKTSYKNGSYSVTGDYVSPGGPEEIGVTLTLTDGVISAVSVEPKATRPKSQNFQKQFADNYKPLVIGKNIDEVNLTKVAGSSLTPKGFDDALEKIKTQAKV